MMTTVCFVNKYGNLLELSQMGMYVWTHYLKLPLDRVSGQVGYAYLLTLDWFLHYPGSYNLQ